MTEDRIPETTENAKLAATPETTSPEAAPTQAAPETAASEPQTSPATAENAGSEAAGTGAEATPESSMSQEELEAELAAQHEAAYQRSMPKFKEGDVVRGTVVRIDREGVLVDVGAKSEGIIRPNELSREPNVSPESIVSIGEEIAVYVLQTDNSEGNLILSKKRADFEKAWDRVLEAKEQGKTISAMVTDRVKGGLQVDLGIRGFVPASHVGNGSLKTNLDRYVGQAIALKVLEVDRDRHKVILSNKLAVEEEREARRAATVASLEVGQTRHGVVRRLTNYGAFVDLGGIDGLLHISEMSWTRINHPSEVLKEGQEIDVLVLKMDLAAGRISLGLRQILPDPWAEMPNRFRPGDVIKGTITRIVPFGVFVQVEGGVEGIIPNSEISYRRGVKAGEVVHQGDSVEVKVLDLRPEERKMSLSLRQVQQDVEVRHERRVVEEFQTHTEQDEPRFTIGDAIRAKEEAEAAENGESDES